MTLALVVVGANLARAQPGRQQPGNEIVNADTMYVPGTYTPRDTTRALDSLRGILRHDMRLDSLDLVALLDSLDNSADARMRRNLAMAPSDWMPTEGERRAREEELRRSMDMDFVFPNSYVQLFGISTGAVFRALGLIEDVTPRIRYTLMRTEPVTVKIYTIQAELVTTLVDSPQRPGEYDFEWDFRDAQGVRVPYGNYVAEVIVGNRLVLRKRIEAP
jgi:hypothetical protein